MILNIGLTHLGSEASIYATNKTKQNSKIQHFRTMKIVIGKLQICFIVIVGSKTLVYLPKFSNFERYIQFSNRFLLKVLDNGIDISFI